MKYSFEFAKRLIESARFLLENSSQEDEAGRAILYLSCLSCEISLKALLESSGYSPKKLKKYSHRLGDILDEVSSCNMVDTGYKASSIRSKEVAPNTAYGTVGTCLESDIAGCSVYPNEIRYGEVVAHFPPDVMLNCAQIVNDWCLKNKGNLVCEGRS